MNAQQPPTLADYTQSELIIPQLATCATTTVVKELTDALYRQDGGMPRRLLLDSSLTALNRELLTSRTRDLGAIFPQVRMAALSQPRFALGRSSEPLPWLTRPFWPITLVFLVLEPENANARFGQLVGTFRNLGRDQTRLEDLRRAATAGELLAVLGQIPLMAVSEVLRLTPITPAPQPSPGTTSYRRWRR